MKKTTLLCAVALMIAVTAQFAGAQYKMRLAYPNMPAFNNPIEMTNAGDGTNRVFVVQQRGLIYVFPNDPSASTRKTFMNNTNVSQSGSEKGLLGMAFHPNYETNRYFFLSFTFDSAGGTWSRIARYEASNVNPDTALLSTQQIFLTLSQPYTNHNGGKIAFGPDGYLYISYGDGGSGGDPQNRAQDSTTLLGKILRINIDSASGGNAYSIPPDNPFVSRPSWKKEIFAYGLRNVWKFNFDYTTGRIWAGDVGQGAWEEIDIIESGKNYGWNKMEGFYCYGTCDTTGKGFTRPIYNYSHSLGISITGGYVYRGSQLPGLYGKYLYADYGAGTLWSLAYDFVNPPVNTTLQDTSWSISSFGEDENREVYILRYSSTTGFIYKIVNTSVITLDLKMAIEGFYNPSLDRLALRDTVKVYLHQATAPGIIVDSASAVVDSTTLKGFFIFNNAPTGLYYVRVTSRNGLDTWSKAGGESLQRGVSNTYDFTTAASQAFGSNQKLVGSKYCVFSGDVNGDGAIDGTDNVMIDNDAFAFATGFLVTDLNGDYTIDGTDLIIADNNAFNFVAVIQP